jgi:hypothetical protein
VHGMAPAGALHSLSGSSKKRDSPGMRYHKLGMPWRHCYGPPIAGQGRGEVGLGLGRGPCAGLSGGGVSDGSGGDLGIGAGVAVGRAPILNVRVISEPMGSSSGPRTCQTNSSVCGLPGAIRPIVTSVVSSKATPPINQLSGQSSVFSDTSTRLVSSGHGQVPLLRSNNENEGREFTYQKRYGSPISTSSASYTQLTVGLGVDVGFGVSVGVGVAVGLGVGVAVDVADGVAVGAAVAVAVGVAVDVAVAVDEGSAWTTAAFVTVGL